MQMRKYVVEFVGTFFLVFTVGMAVVSPGAGQMAPIAIGTALMVMVYSGGHVSGGHFNPAVTLAVFLRGRFAKQDVPAYMCAQVLAAVLAAFVTRYLKGNPTIEAAAIATGPAFLAEFLFTFALAWVVLHVATAKGTAGNSYYGLAIGFTVLTGAYAVGGVSGGAFNPAVAVGITILGLAKSANLWIFLVGDLLGGVAAAIAFKAVVQDEPAPPAA